MSKLDNSKDSTVKKVDKEQVMAFARAASLDAIKVLVIIMMDDQKTAKDRSAAAININNIAWGKPGTRREEGGISWEDVAAAMPQIVMASTEAADAAAKKDKKD